MSWLRFFRRTRWDEERRREMESYVDQETDDNIARGLSPTDARAAAMRKLGNPTLMREEVYQMNTVSWFDNTVRDVTFGVRVLVRQPAFALVAILSLGLGIGANTAIFQLIDAVRLRTLPVDAPQELVRIGIDAGTGGRTGQFTSRYAHLTYGQYVRLRDAQKGMSTLAAWGPRTFDLSSSGESRPTQGLWVSGNFFPMLRLAPALGTLLGPDHDTDACLQPAAVLSHAFWQREFGGDENVIGRTIRLDGHAFPVAGVTPASFFGVEVGRQFDVALPLCAERQVTGGPRNATTAADWWWLGGLGRLAPGVTIEQLNADLKSISAPIFEATVPASYTPATAESYRKFFFMARDTATGYSALRGEYETPLSMLLGLAGLVLLIACGNLANLMLARASAREQEMAVRLAIGASRGRLARQLMSESLLIGLAGALVGMWIATNLSALLVTSLESRSNPLMLDLSANWRVLGFTTLLGIVTCLLFGLVPAIRATRTSPMIAMRAGGRGVIDGGHKFTLRRGLVVAQLSVSLVLLVGALLFSRTFWNLATANVGFTTDGVVAMDFDLRRTTMTDETQPDYHRQLLERVQATPGLQGAAAVSITPMSGSGWNDTIFIDGVKQEPFVWINQVSGNYFALLDIPMLNGRTFDDRDRLGAPRTAVVNQAFVAKFFPSQDPINRWFSFEARPGDEQPPVQIVGVVGDTKYNDIRAAAAPIVHLSYAQDKAPGRGFTAIARARQGAFNFNQAAIAAAAAQSSDILVTVTTLEGPINDELSRERVMAVLSSFFGMLAVALAAIGLYGVMSYTVAQRRQEIGIRMALGAGRGRVLSMVLREAGLLVIVGVVVGAALALVAGKSAESLLFGLSPNDPLTIVIAVTSLSLVGSLASLVPAWRAARVNPTTALR